MRKTVITLLLILLLVAGCLGVVQTYSGVRARLSNNTKTQKTLQLINDETSDTEIQLP